MLLTADEVQRLPADQALLILRGQNLLRLNKFEYWNHPESRKLKPTNINAYIPKWQREQTAAIQAVKQENHHVDTKKSIADHNNEVSRKENIEIHTQMRRKRILVDPDQQSLFINDEKFEQKKPDEI